MCGRFAQAKLDWLSYFELFGDIELPDIPVSFNVKPTQDIAMAYLNDGEMVTSPARWWFVPHWHKGSVKDWKATTFNAKIETAYEKPTFRTAWRHNRCVIPATGYYEWIGLKGKKQPHYITIGQNVPVFFFAGLYSTLGDGIQTATIMTKDAAPEIAELHYRMPVILLADQIESWLACENGEFGLQSGFKHHAIASFGVSDDGADLIIPLV